MNSVMQILKNENLTPDDMQLTERCKIALSVRKSEAGRVSGLLSAIYGVTVTPVPDVDN